MRDDLVDRAGRSCRRSTASSAAPSGVCVARAVALVARAGGPRRVGAELAARRRARSGLGREPDLHARRPGATTVPMSRPSATQSPRASSARCLSTSAARTAGSAARREASSETSGVRIASVTSSPSSSTRSPSNAICRRRAGRGRRPARRRGTSPRSRGTCSRARGRSRGRRWTSRPPRAVDGEQHARATIEG